MKNLSESGALREFQREIFEAVDADGPGSPCGDSPSTTTYVLAMLPRTGSTALCSLLDQTNVFGRPEEYLNPRGPLQHWAQQLRARHVTHYFSRLRSQRRTPNGVFGLKTTYDDFKPLLDCGAVRGLLGDIQFVYLTRNDLVAQSISEYIAEVSGVWHRDNVGSIIHSTEVVDPRGVAYDFARILDVVDRFVRMQQDWERFFTLYSVDPLRVTYEDVCSSPLQVLERFADFLGVPWRPSSEPPTPRTSRMADQRSVEWAKRFRASFSL